MKGVILGIIYLRHDKNLFFEENTVKLFAKQFLLKPKDIRKLKLSIN